ncbi:MAG: transcriptional regulator, TetR family [Candidatus Acidoferrum typicum]|nr:transcriptional regulator, TetR family [Candidatus Acidoferrum typicum]
MLCLTRDWRDTEFRLPKIIRIFEHVHICLDSGIPLRHILNVFKISTTKGKASQAQLLSISLEMFREKGFDSTTMRDIAKAAGMSLGAFYYYYPSKDNIVLDYYRQVQDQHAAQVNRRISETRSMRERLGLLMHTKLDILAGSKDLMGALLRYTGNPDHPLSFLGDSTRGIRNESIALLATAIQKEKLPDDMLEILPMLLWSMQMGILLYMLYDKSMGQERTRKLTDVALDLTVRLIKVARIPVFRPVRKKLRELLVLAGFVNGDTRALQIDAEG